MIEFRLLGQFDVRLENRVIEIASRPAQSLLAYLLLNPTPQRRERLAGVLWPDSSEANARRNLRQALWQIRRALGDWADLLLTVDEITVAFNTNSDHWFDVDVVLQPVDERSAADNLIPMVAAYGGELLPGFYDEWVLLERERLQAEVERKMSLLLERLVTEERWPDILHWGERWIALGHAPEPAYRALMLAHAGLGDSSSVAEVYRRCVEALQRDLDVEPSAQTRLLYERLRRGESVGAPPRAQTRPVVDRPHHNLPSHLTSFIGRDKELAALKQLLTPAPPPVPADAVNRNEIRLLTLTGPGGTGKTRLALQVATDIVNAFADGVWLVELALLVDPELVPQTVAAVLGVREEPNYPMVGAIIEHLRDKALLLILDNCEHLIDTCAQFVDALLRACRRLKILVTSRETLGLIGETVFRVPSLALPDLQNLPPLSELAQYEAIRLFVERATTVRPEFRLNETTAAAVAQICTQLDGVPLAIELAAARVRAMTTEQIAARLDDRFRLLTGGSRTALPRQQTLRAMIDWSWDLLSEPECALLRRLSVFLGGWCLEAAEAVCADDEIRNAEFGMQNEDSSAPHTRHSALCTEDVLEVLTHLVEKSLVVVEEHQGEARYYLLETIRQYAREKLLEAGEAESVRPRHLLFFLKLAEEAEPQLRAAEQLTWLARLDVEHDNLRAALKWAAGSGALEAGLRLAGSLSRFWYLRGYWKEGREWLKLLLTQPLDTSTLPEHLARARSRALAGAGWLADADGSEIPLYRESLALCRQVGDTWGEAFALRGLVVVSSNLSDLEQAEPNLQASLALFHTLQDAWGIGLALFSLGWTAIYRDKIDEAAARWAEALRHFRQCGDRWGISVALGALGYTARLQGNYPQAGALTHDSLTLFRELGDKAGISYSLIRLGNLAWRRGDYAEATALLQESLALQRQRSNQEGIIAALQNQALVAAFQGKFDQATALLDESALLAQARAIPEELSDNLRHQALTLYFHNKLERAAKLFAQSLALSQETNETEGIAFSLYGLGVVAFQQGNYASAAEHLNESLRLWQMRSHKYHIAAVLTTLGRLAQAQGDQPTALERFHACLLLYKEMVDKHGVAALLEGLAASLNTDEQATRLLGAAHAIREAIGAPVPPVERIAYNGRIALLRARLGEEIFAQLWNEGLVLSLEGAIAQALASSDG